MVQLLHTPEGVKDYYNGECADKTALCRRIMSTFSLYGYQEVQTPTFEYFDIFNAERGSVASREMYKLFERDGETLVLRPDFTPAIARCAAKYYLNESLPIRLCYQGNTFINNVSLQGRLKESTQAGVELIGDDSAAADAEMLALVVDCLKSAGLTEFQVEIGQVGFFNGLLEECGISAEAAEELRTLIENKNYFGVEETLQAMNLPKEISDAFLTMPQLFGSAEQVFAQAKSLTRNTTALAAVDRLEQLYEILRLYGMEKYISIDLGMLSNYQYYTGIIFKAYTYGTGDDVVTGGRYNHLMIQFGKDAPAVGFGIAVDTLMSAMQRQKITREVPAAARMILYRPDQLAAAVRLSAALRGQEITVHMIEEQESGLESYIRYAEENHIGQILRPVPENAPRVLWTHPEGNGEEGGAG